MENFSEQKRLTIVILTYNSSAVIESCLQHLNFDKYKVIIVDNASKDNSLEIVRKNFPQAEILQLPKNIGYGSGNNAALKLVKTEFALVLNPDAMIFEKDIEKVLEVMKKNPLIAMAGPVILEKYPLDKEELKEKISYIEKDLNGIRDCYYEKIDGNFSVRFLIGAALFFKTSVMQKIGFFNEKFFLYYEDDELCWKVMEGGYHNMLIPSAVAFHLGGKSSGSSLRMTYKKNWHLAWSKLYWKQTRRGFVAAKRSSIRLMFSYFVRALFSLLAGNTNNVMKNIGYCAGAGAFLFGFEAFDGNGDSRG